ncbi:MAG TPA: hypothetical protein VHB74_09305 [Devosia sp.]|nr:hypothetical protein [Devosia sp.]
MKLTYLRVTALSALAVLASAPAALALDANDFAAKLVATYAYSMPPDAKVSLGNATVSGNDITYDGISFTDKQGTKSLPVKLQFSNVSEGADGSYTAGQLQLPDVDYSSEGSALSIKSIVFKQIYVPGDKTGSVLASSRLFAAASTGPISLTVDGAKVLSLDSVSVNNSYKPSQADANLAEIDSVASTSGLKVDMSSVKDADSAAQIKALGLETLTGKLFESANWSLKDGHLDLAEISGDFDKVGKLKFSIDMSGYTPDFLQSLSSAGQAFASGQQSGDSSASSAAAGKLLQASQALFLNSASLRFDDASITGHLLDMMSAGTPRQAFVDALVASIAQQDSDSSMPPDMVKLVQAAVRAYLTDPHSIELRIAPKTPLGVMGLIGAAMAPQNLADQIGLQIVVNDKPITQADAARESGPAAASGDGNGDNSGASSGDNSDQNATDGSGDDDNSADDNSDNSDDSGDDSGNASGHSTTNN